jgi:hypothetical protein
MDQEYLLRRDLAGSVARGVRGHYPMKYMMNL